eukprot:scaffold47621_cov58-Phaeocystis_antarctica.AAC.2
MYGDLLEHDLLRVAAVGDGLALVVGEHDVTELVVRDVLDEGPLDHKRAAPLVLGPAAELVRIVESALHLSHAAELARGIDAEEEVDRPLVAHLAIGRVEPPVARIGARPDAVLDGLMHVVLRVALDDEEPRRLGIALEVRGVDGLLQAHHLRAHQVAAPEGAHLTHVAAAHAAHAAASSLPISLHAALVDETHAAPPTSATAVPAASASAAVHPIVVAHAPTVAATAAPAMPTVSTVPTVPTHHHLLLVVHLLLVGPTLRPALPPIHHLVHLVHRVHPRLSAVAVAIGAATIRPAVALRWASLG